MTEDDVRCLLLVRAVEQEDRTCNLLTEEDRRQAGLAASAALAGDSRNSDQRYLARRARFAAGRLATRLPPVEHALRHSRWPGWIGWAVPLVAFLFGMAANELGNGRRLDLLAVPLLGTLAWNVAVYAWLALRPLTGRRTHRPQGAERLLTGLSRLGQRRLDRATPLTRALGRFVQDWARAAAPLAAARSARTLHLGAALFALGLVAGIYGRALAIEYRAGWESTFLGPQDVHALLTALLGPASALTGVAIPPVEGIAALRWTASAGAGGDAAPWIHLYTATTLGVIILPRLVLAAWQAISAYRLSRRFPAPGREDFYIRRLLRDGRGAAGSVRVTPYAYRPEPEARARLEALLRRALGDGARVHFDEPLDYGAEDGWLAGAALRPDDDHHVLLFTVSATPEEEIHGRLARALAERLSAERHGTALAAILDESGFRRHFAGQAGLDTRLAARRQAWDRVLAGAGVAPLMLDLAATNEDDAQRIEATLVAGPALEGHA